MANKKEQAKEIYDKLIWVLRQPENSIYRDIDKHDILVRHFRKELSVKNFSTQEIVEAFFDNGIIVRGTRRPEMTSDGSTRYCVRIIRCSNRKSIFVDEGKYFYEDVLQFLLQDSHPKLRNGHNNL